MPEAQQALEHAAAQNPEDPHVWYALGIMYRIGAQYPQALESFKKWRHSIRVMPTRTTSWVLSC